MAVSERKEGWNLFKGQFSLLHEMVSSCLIFLQKQIPSLCGNLGGTVHLRVYHRPRISGRIHILQNVSNLGSTEFQCCTSGYMRSTYLLNSCSFSHQWHKPQTHNTWFQAQRKAAAAPDSSRCDFFWAVNVHSLFLSRNSCAEQSSQSCHLWLYSGTSLHRIQCHNRHMKLENQEWHEEIHVVCK